jgi:hypothetical protein
LFFIGARQVFREHQAAWPFLLYPWAYFAAFALPNPLIFRWYLTPPLPFYILFILVGAERLVTDILAKKRTDPEETQGEDLGWLHKLVPVFLVIAVPFLLSTRDWRIKPDHGLSRPAPEMAWYRLELLYKQAADLLAPQMENSPSPPLLAAGDVGVLGYYTPARILDTVGLNSPETLEYYPLPLEMYGDFVYAVSPELILDKQPDYIVILEIYGRYGLLKDEHFKEKYSLYKKLPTDIYDSDGMLIFVKNP